MENKTNRGGALPAFLIALIGTIISFILDRVPVLSNLIYSMMHNAETSAILNTMRMISIAVMFVVLLLMAVIYMKGITKWKVNPLLLILMPLIASAASNFVSSKIGAVLQTGGMTLIAPIMWCIYAVVDFICYFVCLLILLKCSERISPRKPAGAKLDIAIIVLFIAIGAVFEMLVFGMDMYELAWVGGIFVGLAIFFGVRLPGALLRDRFVSLGDFGGMTYEQISKKVGRCNAESFTVDATGESIVVRQWLAPGYHISLVFKNDLCVGKNHEATV
ncbi:MAG: hypothetical protein IJ493_02775 [Clostridia bacterium]|nr:hypothetical protein [Clostridia bacterium]